MDEYNERVEFSASFEDFAEAYRPDCLRPPEAVPRSLITEMVPRQQSQNINLEQSADVGAIAGVPTSSSENGSVRSQKAPNGGEGEGATPAHLSFLRGKRSASFGTQPSDRWQAEDAHDSGEQLSAQGGDLRLLLGSPG